MNQLINHIYLDTVMMLISRIVTECERGNNSNNEVILCLLGK